MPTGESLLEEILARVPPHERAQAAANIERMMTAYLQGGEEAVGAAVRQVFAEAGKREESSIREEGRGKR